MLQVKHVAVLVSFSSLQSKDNRCWTTLHVAAKYHRTRIMELLADHGGTLRAQTDRKVTPMHVAAMEGYTEIMQLLIDSLSTKVAPRVVSMFCK